MKLRTIIALSLVATASMAIAEEESQYIDKETMSEIATGNYDVRTVTLKTGNIVIAGDSQGVIGISQNGRYKIRGSIVDTWMNQEIASLDDAEQSLSTIPLDAINLSPQSLQAYTLGNGSEEVYVFASPTHEATKDVLATIRSKASEYTFHFVPIPDESSSREDSIAYACASDRQQAVEVLFNGGPTSSIGVDPTCKGEVLSARLIVFQLLGLDQLPVMIPPSGRVLAGVQTNGYSEALDAASN